MLSSGVVNTIFSYADVSYVISTGPISIPAGKSVKVAFAIAAADNFSDLKNVIHQSKIKYQADIATEINKQEKIPTKFSLSQNYPNPFNPTTAISWQIAVSSYVTLKVYDMLGREIATLVNEFKPAGIYNSQFIIHNSQLSSGVYFCTLRANDFVETKKMMLVK